MAQQAETTSETLTLREGDVYRFSYHGEVAQRLGIRSYWCFDGQVVVRGGRLVDTYWLGTTQEFVGQDDRIVKPTDGTLEFVCNLADVVDIQEYEQRYYADADVINLSSQHGCSKRFVVRKGAQRSQDKMLAWLHEQSTACRHEIESRTRNLERLAVQRSKVEAGDTSISIG